MSLALLFTAQNVSNVSTSIFRSLRVTVDLFHGLYCSGSMCVGVTVWFGWGGVVSLCRLKHRTVHHLDSWIKIDQLDVTCFIISLFTAQNVSNVSTSIFRSLRVTVDLFHGLYCPGSMCVGVTEGSAGVEWYPYAGWSCTSACIRIRISRKLLKMDVLTFETCWAVNSEITKWHQVVLSLFKYLRCLCDRASLIQ